MGNSTETQLRIIVRIQITIALKEVQYIFLKSLSFFAVSLGLQKKTHFFYVTMCIPVEDEKLSYICNIDSFDSSSCVLNK